MEAIDYEIELSPASPCSLDVIREFFPNYDSSPKLTEPEKDLQAITNSSESSVGETDLDDDWLSEFFPNFDDQLATVKQDLDVDIDFDEGCDDLDSLQSACTAESVICGKLCPGLDEINPSLFARVLDQQLQSVIDDLATDDYNSFFAAEHHKDTNTHLSHNSGRSGVDLGELDSEKLTQIVMVSFKFIHHKSFYIIVNM